jgi:hypothetical protein
MARRRLRVAAAAFLLAAGSLGAGAAHADDNASQGCTATGNGGLSHGGCVSLAQAENFTGVLNFLCAQEAVQQGAGTTNRGQCLQALRSSIP